MNVLAIDPGTRESAYAIVNVVESRVIAFGKHDNDKVLEIMASTQDVCDVCVIEMLKSYGNIMGDSCLQTCVWVGRFMQAWRNQSTCHLINRKTIVAELCHNSRAKDSNVRQAVIDHFAEALQIPVENVIGKKKSPGPLHGVSSDVWSAIAVALGWYGVQSSAETIFT